MVDSNSSRARRPFPRTGLATLVVALIAGGVVLADWWSSLPDDVRPQYVGRETCARCHTRQTQLFTDSHHDLAMDRATPQTVLGDFNDATLTHHGITSRMFRRGERFFVNTEGPDGTLADFEVKYVLGVDPLQNYMVEFDRPAEMPESEIARLQVLRITWDTRLGRWFHLDPPDVKEKLAPDDILHWTGLAQRWNNMCADCHSTNLRKNYDVGSGVYHTTFSEIDVSCEACHGPGSVHVQLATARSLFWDRKRGYGLARLKDEPNDAEIHSCAPCHARRRVVSTDVRPGDNFYDGYANELLDEATYHADGQILDEVYEFGSFTQSKMYHKNIRCSNCHDVHSTRVRHQGNQLCTSCHAHPAGKYDGPGHHHHQPGGSGAQCVNCHMPVTRYMDVDPRRDHSLRVPRPGLSVELGTPNACTGCHLEVDRSLEKLPELKRAALTQYADWIRMAAADTDIRAELTRLDTWSYEAARRWWGDKADDPKHYAYTFQAARRHEPDAEPRLIALAKDRKVPAIVRATALQYLGESPSSASLEAAEHVLSDAHPRVRAAALPRLESQVAALSEALDAGARGSQLLGDYRRLLRSLKPLLDDSRRMVRVESARIIASVPEPIRREILYEREQVRVDELCAELLAGLEHDNDRAAGHLNRALFFERTGDDRQAEEAYRRAVRTEPRFAGPRSNLAALLDRRAGRWEEETRAAEARGDAQTASRLRPVIKNVRQEIGQLRRDESPLLERDARQLPDNVMLQYRYAMNLYTVDRLDDALRVLTRAATLDPEAENVLLGLALIYQKQKRLDDARAWTKKLIRLRPDNPSYQALLDELNAAK